MSTRNLPGNKVQQARKAENLTATCEPRESLHILQTYWPPRRVTGKVHLLRVEGRCQVPSFCWGSVAFTLAEGEEPVSRSDRLTTLESDPTMYSEIGEVVCRAGLENSPPSATNLTQ
jgi:hypothetical protein